MPNLDDLIRDHLSKDGQVLNLKAKFLREVGAKELAKREDMAYMPYSMVQRWVQAKEQIVSTISTPDGPARLLEIRQQLIKALNDEGARLLLGSDAPQVFNVPGFSIHHEIRSMMDAGLTAYEVLRTGTVAPAEFFEKESEFGRISVGLAAIDAHSVLGRALGGADNLVAISSEWYKDNPLVVQGAGEYLKKF